MSRWELASVAVRIDPPYGMGKGIWWRYICPRCEVEHVAHRREAWPHRDWDRFIIHCAGCGFQLTIREAGSEVRPHFLGEPIGFVDRVWNSGQGGAGD